MASLAVEIDHVSHRYGRHVALRDVAFAIPEGRMFGLLGPNGGGKTTIFRILSTLMPPTEGRARVSGFDTVREASAVRSRLGVVFQSEALDESLGVAENLRIHGALYGLHGAGLEARIDALLERFDLADRRKDRVSTLSGGLRRRTDLARGLLHRPPVLLLDEPTTGLDPAARALFWQLLGDVRRDETTTLVVATHLMEEAERCDEVTILDRGRQVASGTPEALKTAVGAETLWIETPDPAGLAARVRDRFDVAARVVGRTLQLSHPEAHRLLGSLYDAFPEAILSATVRRPTLEDVFLLHTGTSLAEADGVPNLG